LSTPGYGTVQLPTHNRNNLPTSALTGSNRWKKTEGELTAKTEALNLLQTEHGKFQAELNRLQMEKEVLEKQLACGDSTIVELERAKKELIVEREIRDSTIEKLEKAKGKLIVPSRPRAWTKSQKYVVGPLVGPKELNRLTA